MSRGGPRRPGRAAAQWRDGRAAAAGDALCIRRVHPVVLHAGRGAGAVRAAVAGRRLRDDLLVPALSTFVPVLSVWLCCGMITGRADGAGTTDWVDRWRRAIGESAAPAWLAARWLLVPAYLRRAVGVRRRRPATLGREIFPQVRRGAVPAPHQGARRDADREDRASSPARLLDDIDQIARPRKTSRSRSATSACIPSLPDQRDLPVDRRAREGVLRVGPEAGQRPSIAGRASRKQLRLRLAKRFADARFSFEPADIVSEVMSFGSPTPVEVAVTGPNLAGDAGLRREGRGGTGERSRRSATCDSAGARLPDRSRSPSTAKRAGQSGVTVDEVARSLVAATSSSRFVVPNYWPDPKTGIGYQVQVEVPQPQMTIDRRGRASRSGGRRATRCSATSPGSRRARSPASTTATT